MFLEILTNTLGTYWYLLCGMLSKSATLLANDFQKVSKVFNLIKDFLVNFLNSLNKRITMNLVAFQVHVLIIY